MAKWNPTQESINKALRPNRIRKWLNTFLIIVFSCGIIFLIIYFSTHKSDQKSQNNIGVINENVGKTSKSEPESKNQPGGSIVKTEDFDSYKNSSIHNSINNNDLAVTIIDESGNISTSLSSSIANIYNQSGNIAVTGLLRSSFISSPKFQDLFEGNTEIIDKLKLYTHTDYLVLGKVQDSIRKGTLVEGTSICSISISISIISAKSKTILKSFNLSVNGNGSTDSQAKEKATLQLLSKYKSEYSSL